MMTPDTIVVDLDGTTFDIDHRVHLAHEKQWDEFNALAMDDKLYPDLAFFLETVGTDHADIIFLTGRSEKFRPLTMRQLEQHGISSHATELLMRPDGDNRQDGVLKVAMLSEHFGSLEEAKRRVAFILEDRDRVVEAYRAAGFNCWQVRVGGY